MFHKLEKTGYLLTHALSVQQSLITNIVNSKSEDIKQHFSIFIEIFLQTNTKFIADLDKQNGAITLFLPVNKAFESLRKDQVKSLMIDPTCAHQFLTQLVLYEEVCPLEIFKHQANYSSTYQKAQFMTLLHRNENTLYFNAQKVNTSKNSVFYSSNGAIYRLNTVRLNENIRFLYDLILMLIKNSKLNIFFDQLSPKWTETLKEEGYDVTLFIPNPSKINDLANIELNNEFSFFNIKDYLIKHRFTHYELIDSQVLTSLSNKNYLINVYPLADSIPDIFSFAPVRNFELKSINCIQIEVSDIKACGSQIMLLQSGNFKMPTLNSLSFWNFLMKETEYDKLFFLLYRCGPSCLNLYKNFTDKKISYSSGMLRKGYTILLPTDTYFRNNKNIYDKFYNDTSLFKKTMESNMFYGTYCQFALKDEQLMILNFLNRKVYAHKMAKRIDGSFVYLSDKGIVAYKSFSF